MKIFLRRLIQKLAYVNMKDYYIKMKDHKISFLKNNILDTIKKSDKITNIFLSLNAAQRMSCQYGIWILFIDNFFLWHEKYRKVISIKD